MLLDQRLVRLTLQAAVRHAKAHGGSDPRGATIYFVRCVLVDMKKRRWYDKAYTISRILGALETHPTVKEAAAVFGLVPSDFAPAKPAHQPPTSNTGVTPRTENQTLALEEHLNGRANRSGR